MVTVASAVPSTLLRSIDSALRCNLPRSSAQPAGRLDEVIEFAIFPGGKRTRPILTLLTAGMVTGNIEPAFAPAAALEFLHTSSLIFDDLPCMDDAGVRRARPALHLRFGEANAILAGLALLNQAYAILKHCPPLLDTAVEAIGLNGMIGGQAADLSGGPAVIRNQKTASLMKLTMIAGPLACSATGRQVEVLTYCGECLGEAYQVLDDMLDRLPASSRADKTVGQDERHSRTSNYGELGHEGCQRRLGALVQSVRDEITGRFPANEPRHRLLQMLEHLFMGSTA